MRYTSGSTEADTPAETLFVWLFAVLLGAFLGAVIGAVLAWRALLEFSSGNDQADLALLKWSAIGGAAVGLVYCVIQLLQVRASPE